MNNSVTQSSHGGKRAGAGNKFKWQKGKTKVIRIPEKIADKILKIAENVDRDLPISDSEKTLTKLKELISDWDKKTKGKTSPRYVQLNYFLKETKKILGEKEG